MDLKAKPREFKPYKPFSNDPPPKPPTENLGKPTEIKSIPQENPGQTQSAPSQQQSTSNFSTETPPLNNEKTTGSSTPLPNVPYKENLTVASRNGSIIKKF